MKAPLLHAEMYALRLMSRSHERRFCVLSTAERRITKAAVWPAFVIRAPLRVCCELRQPRRRR